MYIARDGKILEIADADWAKSSYAAKGWAPCDPPVVIAPAAPTYQDLRRQAYDAQGITTEALALAMWEAQMEPSTAHSKVLSDIQATRAAIKAQFPKS